MLATRSGGSFVSLRDNIGKWSLIYQSNLAKPCQRHLANQSELGRMGSSNSSRQSCKREKRRGQVESLDNTNTDQFDPATKALLNTVRGRAHRKMQRQACSYGGKSLIIPTHVALGLKLKLLYSSSADGEP